MKRRDAFGVSIRRRQASVDEETVPVLHQRVTDEAELRLLANTFAIEPRFGIGPRSMRLVRAFLAVEVRFFVASAALGRRVVRPILGRARTAFRNFAAISPSSRRSRFFENTE